ncbi:hypothetical protein HK097_004860, partial [Rhizophlyctis rosea]
MENEKMEELGRGKGEEVGRNLGEIPGSFCGSACHDGLADDTATLQNVISLEFLPTIPILSYHINNGYYMLWTRFTLLNKRIYRLTVPGMGDYVSGQRRSTRLSAAQVQTTTTLFATSEDPISGNASAQKARSVITKSTKIGQEGDEKPTKRRRVDQSVEEGPSKVPNSVPKRLNRKTVSFKLTETVVEIEPIEIEESPPKRQKRASKKAPTVKSPEDAASESKPGKPQPKKRQPKSKAKPPSLTPTGTELALETDTAVEDEDIDETPEIITVPPLDTTAMWERAQKTRKHIGAHVSGAKGLHNAILNSVKIGGTSFAFFPKNQRRLQSPPTPPVRIAAFKEAMEKANYPKQYILPHGSYLINLANADEEKREVAYQVFLDDLKRCEELGLELYNFHPGSATGHESAEAALSLISSAINRAHKETTSITIVVEMMSGAGKVVGSTFEELATIIQGVDNTERVGVCLDTCHMFAAGYDMRTPETYTRTMSHFSRAIGFKYLKGLHLNDSKCPIGSVKDRHENLGKGHLGWDAFKHIVNDPRLDYVPMVLETPESEKGEGWRREIDQLYELCGEPMEVEGVEG